MTTESAERQALRKLERALGQARTSIDPTVPVQVVQTLLKVALHEGSTLTELAEQLGANVSTASRHLQDLGARNRKGEQGYLLVASETDSQSMRTKRFTLTPKGRLVVKALAQLIAEE